MGVQLNIKDRTTIELARTLAKRNGKSVTATIREALEQADRARRREAETRTAEILASLRLIAFEEPPELKGKSSREIIKAFHEQEWREQYGPDEWS